VERLPAVLKLAELARKPLGDGMDFRPIRRPLGVSAFGINAYTTDEGTVIEPHDELGGGSGGHEELYFVAAGHARFVIDGEETDAPAGTILFIQPDQHRSATAHAPDTTVLVIGGKPGAAGPPSPFEYWYMAIGEEPERAYAIAAEGLEHYPDNPGLHYNLACYAALGGRREDALRHIKIAIDARPESREWALEDEELALIHSDIENDLP
jgi:quercetin dioxygenase-like cupin family protein